MKGSKINAKYIKAFLILSFYKVKKKRQLLSAHNNELNDKII